MPENGGKGNEYMTCSVTENGCLPYEMVLIMLTMLPGTGSRGYWSQLSVLFIPETEVVTGKYLLECQNFLHE